MIEIDGRQIGRNSAFEIARGDQRIKLNTTLGQRILTVEDGMRPTLFEHHIGSQTIEPVAVVSEVNDMCLGFQMRAWRKHIKSGSRSHHIARESVEPFLANEVLNGEAKRHQISTIGLPPNIKCHVATKATQAAAKRELRGIARSAHRHVALQGHAIGQQNVVRKLRIEFHEQRIELVGVELQTHIGTPLLGRIDMIELP